ncbi:MAG: hypothetical protein ACKKMW_02360 [Candidatus Nealsonbacteria bacterium]
MDKQIKQILRDVYLIDQSLKMHEKTLIKIIQELLRSKPESKIDEQFVRELRVKIIERAKLLSSIKPHTNMFNTLFNKKFTYALVGIAIIVCAIIITNLPQENGKLAINDLGENAFGDLSFSQEVQSPDTSGRGGGGNGEIMGVVSPEMVNYNFIYAGDDFTLDSGQITVYKMLKGDFLNKALSNVANNLDLNVLNLNKFQNVKIGNIEISENRDFGYSIYIYPRQNSLSINANWEKWPREEFDTPAEMLTDEELLSISDKFLAEYGINTDLYEKGEVTKHAGIGGVIPENIPIVYPLKIDDQIIYDQGGQKYGMNVSVSLRHKKVVNVYSIVTNTFESSKYAKETNKDKIISFAEDGGLFKNYTYPNAVKTLDLELGTPEVSLVRMWQRSENKMDTAEILVPSLVFPVITEMSSEQTYFYRTNVIVPLVGEILDQYNKPIPDIRTFE